MDCTYGRGGRSSTRSAIKLARAGVIAAMDEALLARMRRVDPDRFFALLLAPAERRAALLALTAFNHELAHAREAAREPTLALIRLQWWREVVEGTRPARHEVATPLLAAVTAGELARADLLAMIAAREIEADPEIPDRSAWEGWLAGTGGGFAVAAGRALGAPEALETRLRRLGAASALAGQLRNIPAHARQGRCLLPADALAAHGLDAATVMAHPDTPALRPLLEALAGTGRAWLAEAGGALPRRLLAAVLPAVLARGDLRQPGAPRPRRLGARLAMLGAALLGRV